jgi:hypothetical protein
MSTLLQTIETDLAAGESWLEDEAESVGLAMWNALKAGFIALGPAAGKLVMDTLNTAVTAAQDGDTVEQIETAALNTATTDAKTALQTLGSAGTQQLIIGLRAANV